MTRGLDTHGRRWRASRVVPLLAFLAVVSGCHRGTGRLSDEQQKRFEAEGIVRRAVDVDFHRTHAGRGSRSSWDEGYASIVVTHASVVIHSDDRVLFEITPRSTGYYRVGRDHDRVAIRGGRGQSAVSWSFRPAEDPDGWARDVRAVIQATAGRSRRSSG